MRSKNYIRVLFSIFAIILIVVVTYISYFAKHYPLPFTNHLSLDAKFKFIREHIDVQNIDTIVIGSSLGLNNVDGVHLENVSNQVKGVLNFSAFGLSAPEVRQLLELSDVFPRLKRIIYSAQYSDFSHRRKLEDFDVNFFKKYINNDFNFIYSLFIKLRACNDIAFCFNRQQSWDKKNTKKNLFSYLGFDKTGSVPLDIYGDDIIHGRWVTPQPGAMQEDAYGAAYHMSKRASGKGIKFYFIQQSYRQPIIERDNRVKHALMVFSERMRKIMEETNGYFMSIHETLHLSDAYFADRTHFNDKGSMLASEAIGKFIDESE